MRDGSIGKLHSRILPLALMLLFIFSSVPAHANMTWIGAVDSNASIDSGGNVAYSNNGAILVSAHQDELYFYNPVTNDLLPYTITVDYPIHSLQFSNDDRYIIVGMESKLSNTPATVVLELIDGKYTRLKHTENGENIDALSFAPDNDVFATSNEQNGITEWSISNGIGSTAATHQQYPVTHTGNITCFDHTLDGDFLLSGGEDGIVILWNRSDGSEHTRWEEGSPIFDCHVSDDGTMLAWMIEGSLHIRNYDQFISYYAQIDIDSNARRFAFTNNNSEVAILVPGFGIDFNREIQFMSIVENPYPIVNTLSIGHIASDFSIHPTENIIAISTDSRLISIYSDSKYSPNPSNGLDTDFDGVANLFDNDDDGDGILDEFDLVCNEGSTCDIHPDVTTIRQVEIDISGNDMDIYDTIFLTKEDSTALRDLTSQSIYRNSVVDDEEAEMIAASVCSHINQSYILEQWSDAIDIDGRNFIAQNVECAIRSGLYDTYRNDERTRVEVRWHITGKISAPAIAPYNLSISDNFVNLEGSVGLLVHQSPVHLEVYDISGADFEVDIWHAADTAFTAYIDIPPPDEQTTTENALALMKKYIFIIVPLLVIIFVISLIGFVRHQNKIDLDYDNDNEYQYDDSIDEIIDDAVGWDEWYEESAEISKKQPKPPAAVEKDIRRRPAPPQAVIDDIYVKDASDDSSTQDEIASDDDNEIEFKHLIDDDEGGHKIDSDDDEIEEAMEFFKKSVSDTQKRRPVRRKRD